MTNGHKITDKLAEIHGNEDFTIAFLPYKRSMWSSMKSVYESCKNAHIYPLPYYLINHKGLVERLAKDNFDNAEDIKTLKDNFEKMEKVFDYQLSLSKNYIFSSMWGDHGGGLYNLSPTACMYHAAIVMTSISKLLSNKKARIYSKIAKNIKNIM